MKNKNLQTITKNLLTAFTKHIAVPNTIQSEAEEMLQSAELVLTACKVLSGIGDCTNSITLYEIEKELNPLVIRLKRTVDREIKLLTKQVEKKRTVEYSRLRADYPITLTDINRAKFWNKQNKLQDELRAIQDLTNKEEDFEKRNAFHQQAKVILNQMQEMISGG